jgi:integrase
MNDRQGVRRFEEEQCSNELESHGRRKRGDGRIWRRGIILWIQYYAYGQQVRESSHSTRWEVANRLLAKRRAEINAESFVNPAARRLRYEEMRDALYADYQANRRRWLRTHKDGARYICGVAHLDDFFAGCRAASITKTRIREFIVKRQTEGASNGTINRELALLRRMFNLAVEDELLRSVPHFPMLKEASPRKGFLEYADFQKLRRELPEYLRTAATMGYCTGMRLGEILRIRWENVDFRVDEIRLNPGETKNDEPRTVPLIGELREMLKIERDKNPGAAFVFLRNSQPIGSFYKAWRSACQRAQLDGLLFHDLRRTGVRNLVRAGMSERVAMAISGHQTRDVFERYNIVSGRDLDDAKRKLESYLATQKPKRGRHLQREFGDNSGTIGRHATSGYKTSSVN